MKIPQRSVTLISLSLLLALACILIPVHSVARAQDASNPWSSAQAIQPSQLAALLAKRSGPKPVILQVGFQVLYRGAHIPGAIYAGPASSPEGLQALKRVARTLPRTAEIYVYCGCCPMQKCPNIRPAFRTLQSMGFTHLHVLTLPDNFAKDWVVREYPTAGESASTRE